MVHLTRASALRGRVFGLGRRVYARWFCAAAMAGGLVAPVVVNETAPVFLGACQNSAPVAKRTGAMAVLSLLAGSLHGEAAVWLDIDATHTVDVVIFRCEVLQNVVLAKRLRWKGSGGAAIEATALCVGAWTSRDSSTELAATLVAGGGVCIRSFSHALGSLKKSLPFSLCRCSSSSCGQMCWEKPTSARAKRLTWQVH